MRYFRIDLTQNLTRQFFRVNSQMIFLEEGIESPTSSITFLKLLMMSSWIIFRVYLLFGP